MRGIPHRTNPGSAFIFEDGSTWSAPLYSCASTVKATIKTVTFFLNGTDIKSLKITKIVNRSYKDTASMPLWGFEESGLNLVGISPLWGLINETYTTYPNMSFWRKPSLYLSGTSDELFGRTLGAISGGDIAYTPGSDFAPAAMNDVYRLGSTGSVATNAIKGYSIDYTGAQNMAMYLRWQELSKTADSASKILNLIWTDFAASAVVGTRGILGPGNLGKPGEAVKVEIEPVVRKIKYHILFAIPAFILAFALLLISLATILSCVLGEANLARLRMRLNQGATGRVMIASLEPSESIWTMSSKEWSQEYGKVEINLGTYGEPNQDTTQSRKEDIDHNNGIHEPQGFVQHS